jgi:hypothetical protein
MSNSQLLLEIAGRQVSLDQTHVTNAGRFVSFADFCVANGLPKAVKGEKLILSDSQKEQRKELSKQHGKLRQEFLRSTRVILGAAAADPNLSVPKLKAVYGKDESFAGFNVNIRVAKAVAERGTNKLAVLEAEIERLTAELAAKNAA